VQTRAGFTLVEMMIVIVIIGLLMGIALPNFLSMQARAREARVHWNAHSLQMAAEDFAAQNNSVYATDFTTLMPNGDALLDLIPLPLENPFDPSAVAVVDAVPANDGEVGYDTTGRAGVGYVITGLGRNAVIVSSLTNGS
jgi:prepilin-type N-terminal cleavage/methylation domain-containing protein